MDYSILDENVEVKIPTNHYFTREEWDSYEFAGNEDIEAFKDLRFGLFLHVGISAIGKVDMSWPMKGRKMPDMYSQNLDDAIYYSWVDKFKFEDFNADEWISVAKSAGMKYVVVITKHHDGFHMWPTKHCDFNISTTQFKRDYIKEISDACHKQGLKLGLYYSQRDWHHPDYEAVDPTKATSMNEAPCFKMKDGEVFAITDKHKKYIEYMHKAVIELMTNYGKVDILWWDSSYVGGMFRSEMWDSETIEHAVRKLQPHIVINNRAGLVGDYDTPEGHVGFCQTHRAWETCMKLGKHWAWTNTPPKRLKVLLAQLVMSACGDGNYLLSIGCKPSGALADADIARLKQMGNWLAKYGESIYATRVGAILPNGNIGSTQNDKAMYIHMLKGKSVKVDNFDLYHFPQTALTGENIVIEKVGNSAIIKVKRKISSIDVVIKLEKKGSMPNVGL